MPHPLRCTRAAIAEALAWGARAPRREGRRGAHQPTAHLGDRGRPAGRSAGARRPGLRQPRGQRREHGRPLRRGRLVMVCRCTPASPPSTCRACERCSFDSALPLLDIGRWDHLREPVCDALRRRGRSRHAVLPPPAPGVGRADATCPWARPPERRGASFERHAPPTRRCWAHRATPIDTDGAASRGCEWAETGSPKDYPGTWTGYVVHEGGVRQVVRRVAEPDCIRWTEHTRQLAFGAWGRWSPGSLADRCFVHAWSDDQRDARRATPPAAPARRGRS